MDPPFRIVTTAAFESDTRKRTRAHRKLADVIEQMIAALEIDPCNVKREHDIRKLAGVKPGDGQWRMRRGKYRLRYDVFGRDVVLHSFRHRKESY